MAMPDERCQAHVTHSQGYCANKAVMQTGLGTWLCRDHHKEWFGYEYEPPLDLSDASSHIDRIADRMQKGEGHE
jgi:ribosomal protein L37AE/L43A